jgi:hypothetical protein
MTDGLTIFQYQQKQFRVTRVDEDGTFWVVAKDVCDILGLSDVSMAIQGLDADEKGTSQVGTLGGPQKMAVISEAGLYAFIFRSNKPQDVIKLRVHEMLQIAAVVCQHYAEYILRKAQNRRAWLARFSEAKERS